MKDERLERISDDIRKGIPVGMVEAIEAINYQGRLRAERNSKTLWARFKAWVRNQTTGEQS